MVDHGYMKTLDAARSGGKIVLLFVLSVVRVPVLSPLMLLLPFIMLIRMHFTERTATLLRLKLFRSQNKMVSHVRSPLSTQQPRGYRHSGPHASGVAATHP